MKLHLPQPIKRKRVVAKRIIDYNEVDLKRKKLDDKLRKAAHRRNYYLKNKEKELSKQKEYKQKNKETIAAYQKLYNPDYQRMYRKFKKT